MQRIFLLLHLFIACYTFGQTPPATFDYKRDFKSILDQTQNEESPLAYKKLLPRFQANDTSLTNPEVLALMIGFTENTYYRPLEDMEKEQEIFDLNEEKKYEKALEEALRYLNDHPLSLRVLKEASYSYLNTNRKDSANYYMDLVEKIMNAMIYSGSGKKPESPIFALGLADGEWFVPNIGMKVANKNTDWNKYNHFIEIVDASKNLVDLMRFYFVINHAKLKIDDDKADASDDKKKKKDDKKKSDKKKDDKKWQSKKDKKDKNDKKSKEAAPEAAPVQTPSP